MSRYNNRHNDQGVIVNFLRQFSLRTIISVVILLIVGTCLALIGTKTVAFFRVPTSSMEPTFIPGDQLISIRKSTYNRGDIIVLDDPEEEGAFLLKRLVAIGGDTVSISPKGLRVNNVLIHEPYLQEPITYRFETYTVGENEIFILGDNRNYSADSHKWGHGVPASTIIGQARYIYAPSDRFTTLEKNNPAFVLIKY